MSAHAAALLHLAREVTEQMDGPMPPAYVSLLNALAQRLLAGDDESLDEALECAYGEDPELGDFLAHALHCVSHMPVVGTSGRSPVFGKLFVVPVLVQVVGQGTVPLQVPDAQYAVSSLVAHRLVQKGVDVFLLPDFFDESEVPGSASETHELTRLLSSALAGHDVAVPTSRRRLETISEGTGLRVLFMMGVTAFTDLHAEPFEIPDADLPDWDDALLEWQADVEEHWEAEGNIAYTIGTPAIAADAVGEGLAMLQATLIALKSWMALAKHPGNVQALVSLGRRAGEEPVEALGIQWLSNADLLDEYQYVLGEAEGVEDALEHVVRLLQDAHISSIHQEGAGPVRPRLHQASPATFTIPASRFVH